MTSKQRQFGRSDHSAGVNFKTRSAWTQIFDCLRRDVGCMRNAELNHFAAKIAAKLRDIRIVGIQECHSAWGKGCNELVFCASDARNTIRKKLKMNGGHRHNH